MAYFSNVSEGTCFDDQCAKCKFGQSPCPIALVQMTYNYDQIDNDVKDETVATKILNELVKQDGTCTVFEMAKADFEMAKADFEIDPNQQSLF